MKRALITLVALLPGFCFGMDRLTALSIFETGDDDTKVGRAGEISRYQILKTEWTSVTTSTRYQDPEVAKQVALKLLDQRIARFQRVYHRAPSDFEFYGLWNAPGQVLRGRISPVVTERCTRFSNLCKSDNNAVVSVPPRRGASGNAL